MRGSHKVKGGKSDRENEIIKGITCLEPGELKVENGLLSRGQKNEKKIIEPLNGSKSRDKVNTGK